MEKADIGLIGLGVMGQNLALNLAGKGWKVAVWNRTVPGKEEHIVDNFIAKRAQGKSIVGTQTLEEFVDALKAAGQSYWQILPLGPTSYGVSHGAGRVCSRRNDRQIASLVA